MAEPTLNQPAFLRQLVSSVPCPVQIISVHSGLMKPAARGNIISCQGWKPGAWSHTGATLEPQCHSDVAICCHVLSSHGGITAEVKPFRWCPKMAEGWRALEWMAESWRAPARVRCPRHGYDSARGVELHFFRYSGCRATIRTSLCLTTMVTKRTCPARMAILWLVCIEMYRVLWSDDSPLLRFPTFLSLFVTEEAVRLIGCSLQKDWYFSRLQGHNMSQSFFPGSFWKTRFQSPRFNVGFNAQPRSRPNPECFEASVAASFSGLLQSNY